MAAKKRKKSKSLSLKRYQSLFSRPKILAAVLVLAIGLGYVITHAHAAASTPQTIATWNRYAPQLRQCEAGGNYRDNTGNGYYGAYQMTTSTWQGSFGYQNYRNAQGGRYNNASDAPAVLQDLSAYENFLATGFSKWQCYNSAAGSSAVNHPYSGGDDSTGSQADNHDSGVHCGNPPDGCAGRGWGEVPGQGGGGGSAPAPAAPAPAGGSGVIQGYKVESHNNAVPFARLSIVDGSGTGQTLTSNPYFFRGLNGLSRVRVSEIPAGWYLHGVTSCNFGATCSNGEDNMQQINGTGTDAVVNAPNGGGNDLWWHFDQAPQGFLDNADCTHLRGWALDHTDGGVSTNVHIYVDGNMIAQVQANGNDRPDVNSVEQVPGAHGFDWPLPSQFQDGGSHRIQVYAIDYPYGHYNPLLQKGDVTISGCGSSGGGGGGGTFHPLSTGDPVIVPEPGTPAATGGGTSVTDTTARCNRLQGVINFFTRHHCGATGPIIAPSPTSAVPVPIVPPPAAPAPAPAGNGRRNRRNGGSSNGACPYVSGYVAQLLGC